MATSQRKVSDDWLKSLKEQNKGKGLLGLQRTKGDKDHYGYQQMIQTIKMLCNNIIDDQDARTLMRSLDFYGMPIKFNESMTLEPGERPGNSPKRQKRAETMAVIDPHRRLSDNNLNPLVKYFDDTYGVSNSIEN